MLRYDTFTAVLLCLFPLMANAQSIDPQTSRWLLQNPASSERGDRLIEAETEQMATTGEYNVSPFKAPALHQLRPSLQHLQYFYDGQAALNALGESPTQEQINEVRARYQTLYDMHDAAYQAEAEYYLGYCDYVEGNYESALQHFGHLPQDEKYEETVPFYRMQILYAQGKWDEAVQAIDAYTPADKALQAEALRLKAECKLQSGNYEDALSCFREYLSQTSDPVPSSAYNAGILEYDARHYESAFRDAALATRASQPELRQFAYMLVGQSALQQGETQQARLAYSQACTITDGNADTREAAAYDLCAIVYSSNTSLFGDDIEILENFLNTWPTSGYAGRVSGYLTDILGTTTNYEAALTSIAKIRKPDNNLLQAKQRIHCQYGIQRYVNGDYRGAAEQFTLGIDMGKADHTAWSECCYWRGEARYRQNQFQEAAADYSRFIKSKPKDAQKDLYAAAYYNLGYAQMQLNLYTDAIGSFTDYISQPGEFGTQGYVDGVTRLADCYYYTRQFATAEVYYHTAAEYESKQADYALYQEALMMGLQKKYSQKQAKLDEMITRCTASSLVPEAWLDKGRTSLLQNDAEQAISSFRQVLDLYPDCPAAPQAAVELAMTYNNLGQTEAAQQVYQLVEEKYPDTEAALTAAEDLHTLGIQRQVASLPQLYNEGQYQQLLDVYQQLQSENIDFSEAQTMQLLAAKANLALGHQKPAVTLLQQASQEVRTAAGSEARFLLAQTYFDTGDISNAQTVATELVQSGTPHQYWLARGIILLSDIFRRNGDTFTADEYLKSLQQNYTDSGDDIASLIRNRLPQEEQKEQ